ncbi:HK97 family phage prohead protease [Nafulsella turpanensis]|uniref:HK97 family phage prohead protease n=1 Tax=Nafulsella turpanensis TaxID=1265690 RepID=UPI000345A0EB|nr:HK97 family phage prohead protease [Nafulsella turpanensis]
MKEKRILIGAEFNTRALKDEAGNKIIEGYAAVFNHRSKLLFENGKLFYEVIERGAFDDVLKAEDLDVVFTYQHNRNEPLSRLNRSKGVETLTLSTDEKGLFFRAILNDTTTANDTYKRIDSGEVFECSFVFTVTKEHERWERDEEGNNIRYISKINSLHDVAAVVDGAYSSTDIAVAQRSFEEFQEQGQPVVEEVPDTYFDQLKIEILKLS